MESAGIAVIVGNLTAERDRLQKRLDLEQQACAALVERVKVLEARDESARHLYGACSANGDVVDWLYVWLKDRASGSARAVLQIHLARSGYDDAAELLAPPAEVP